MIEEKLKNTIKEALKELGVEAGDFDIEYPGDLSHGDFSTNVAMVFGKKLGKNPKEFAEEILKILQENKPEEVYRIEVAGPGFINFHLSREFFTQATTEVLKEGKNWGRNHNLKGQKVIIEHTQPNPFKEFHIGHLVNNTVGEAVSKITEAQGAELKKATYHGDVGLHVAKAIWGMRKGGLDPDVLSDWGKSYASGDKAYSEDENAKKEITEINKKVYQGSDSEINELYQKGRGLSLKHFEELYLRLGSKFHKNFFESEAGEIGQKLVEEFLEKGVFEESQGAVIFSEEKSGLHTRVFINSEGLPTYEAKDLGLIKLKREFFDFDRSVTITDVEQSQYYKVVTKAAEFVFPELSGKIEHLSHGRLRLAEGRMSSRTGNIISGVSLLDNLKDLALSKMEEREIESKEKVADQIAVSALKYSVLKQSPGRNIVFDFEKSLSFEGDSGPYLQYTAVRAGSVIQKAQEEGIKREGDFDSERETTEVERILFRFPEVVKNASQENSPHHIVTFLTELAGAFNSFYAKEKIVDKEDKNSPYKVALTEAVQITLKNGLEVLGIEVPEKM